MEIEGSGGGDVDIKTRVDASRFRDYFEKRESDFEDFVRSALRRVGDAGEVSMMEYAPKDRGGGGGLISQISARMESPNEISIAPRMRSPYPVVMITGTRPFYPPFDPIERWARRKGLPGGAIWRSITQRGIKSAEESDHRVDYGKKTREDMRERTPKIFEDEVKKWIKGGGI